MEIFWQFLHIFRGKTSISGSHTCVVCEWNNIFKPESTSLSTAWLDTWTAKVSVEGTEYAILRVWCAPPLPLLSGQTSFAVKRSCPQGFNSKGEPLIWRKGVILAWWVMQGAATLKRSKSGQLSVQRKVGINQIPILLEAPSFHGFYLPNITNASWNIYMVWFGCSMSCLELPTVSSQRFNE